MATTLCTTPFAHATDFAPDTINTPNPTADKTPYVPRYQGPYSPSSGTGEELQELWGFSLVGTGAVLGGLGFYSLETNTTEVCSGTGENLSCVEHDRGKTRLGATLLIGGIFLTGMGIYLIANADTPATSIIIQDFNSSLEQLSVEPVEGGAVVGSQFQF